MVRGADQIPQDGSRWGALSAAVGQWLGLEHISSLCLAVGDGRHLRPQLGLLIPTCGVPMWPGFPHNMMSVSKKRRQELNDRL